MAAIPGVLGFELSKLNRNVPSLTQEKMSPFFLLFTEWFFFPALPGPEGGRSEAEADRSPPLQTGRPVLHAEADAARDAARQEILSNRQPSRVGFCEDVGDGLAILSI